MKVTPCGCADGADDQRTTVVKSSAFAICDRLPVLEIAARRRPNSRAGWAMLR